METKITYIPYNAKIYEFKEQQKRTGYDEMGYCKKGSTNYFVVLPDSKRKHKVFVTCFSNCASHWIIENKQVFHINELSHSDILKEV